MTPASVDRRRVWEQALIAAQGQAQIDLAEIRATLDAEHTELQNAQHAARAAKTAAAAAVEAASQARALAEARLDEAQRLIDQQTAQLADLSRQRDALTEQVATLDQAANALRDRLQTQETATASERDSWALHVRSVEDRAHGEVDRVRLEIKELRIQFAAAQRDLSESDMQHRQQFDAMQAALARAEREVAAQRARGDVLEQQLSRLASLPTQSSLEIRSTARKRKAGSATRETSKQR